MTRTGLQHSAIWQKKSLPQRSTLLSGIFHQILGWFICEFFKDCKFHGLLTGKMSVISSFHAKYFTLRKQTATFSYATYDKKKSSLCNVYRFINWIKESKLKAFMQQSYLTASDWLLVDVRTVVASCRLSSSWVSLSDESSTNISRFSSKSLTSSSGSLSNWLKAEYWYEGLLWEDSEYRL